LAKDTEGKVLRMEDHALEKETGFTGLYLKYAKIQTRMEEF